MDALSGVRVVEMGLWVAGPAAGGMLADWGADVVKVEAFAGDPMRNLYGAMSDSSEQRCPPFDLLNRGKRSVAVDVNRREGQLLMEKLLANADVFVTNMRPAFLERVGLDHATVLAAHPHLVYASLTGYGLTGPDRDAPGYDVGAFSARSGMTDRSTPPGEAPPTLPGGAGDNITGMAMVAAILAGLLQRERTGKGQLVATSLLRTGMYCVGMELSTRLGLNRLAPTASRRSPPNPLMNSYLAGDGQWFWLMGAEPERHWPALLEALGQPPFGSDPRFARGRDRRRNAEALVTALDEIFLSRSREAWAELFVTHDVWWQPVNSIEDLLSDEQVLACGGILDVPGNGGPEDGAPVRNVATPVDFGSQAPHQIGPVPKIGEHTEAVLRELGLGDDELLQLHEAGVLLPALVKG